MKSDLINKLNILLFGILILLLIVYGAIMIDQNSVNEDISVSDSIGLVEWEDCSGDKSDQCAVGLTCVQLETDQFLCSKLTNGSACDMNDQVCEEGSQCINTKESREDDKDVYRCTDNEKNSVCGTSDDCKEDLECAKFDFHESGRCIPSARSQRTGWTFCDANFTCANEHECVTGITFEDEEMPSQTLCSNLGNSALCDAEELRCNTGATCIKYTHEMIVSTNMFYCTTGVSGSVCTEDSHCNNDLVCRLGAPQDFVTTCLPRLEEEEDEDDEEEFEEIVCGKLDSNASGKIDLPDFSNFISKWRKVCSDTPQE